MNNRAVVLRRLCAVRGAATSQARPQMAADWTPQLSSQPASHPERKGARAHARTDTHTRTNYFPSVLFSTDLMTCCVGGSRTVACFVCVVPSWSRCERVSEGGQRRTERNTGTGLQVLSDSFTILATNVELRPPWVNISSIHEVIFTELCHHNLIQISV